jgi:1,4-alpha-glucan branching enzyme
MRILLVSPEYPPHHIGGGGVVVQSLARTLLRKGHKVTVVAGYHPTKSFFERVKSTNDCGVRVFWLPLLPTPVVSFQLKTIMPPNVFSLAFLSELLVGNQYDVINIHGYGHFLNDFVALIGKLLSKSYVATIHGIPKQPGRQAGMLGAIFWIYHRTLGRVFLGSATAITAVSRHTAQDTIIHGGDSKKIVVIPNGVDFEAFANPSISGLSAVRRRYKLEGRTVLLGVGRLSEAKGFQFLLRSMPRILKEVPNAYLVIAGADGGYRSKLMKIIDDLDLNDCVELAGEVNEDIKIALYSVAEVVVIPSIVEPFGMVALEALSAGKPTVASDIEGLSEIFKETRLGLYVPPGNSEEVAKKVVAALTVSRSNEAIARLSRKRAASYRWDDIGELYMKLFKNEMNLHLRH